MIICHVKTLITKLFPKQVVIQLPKIYKISY